jgi:hypothetical protein
MAKDVTVRVTGTNADGSINVQMPEGANPFLNPIQQGSMVPYNPSAGMTSPSTGYRARINGQDINFASEADFLKAERLWQEMSNLRSRAFHRSEAVVVVAMDEEREPGFVPERMLPQRLARSSTVGQFGTS